MIKTLETNILGEWIGLPEMTYINNQMWGMKDVSISQSEILSHHGVAMGVPVRTVTEWGK